MKLIVGLGNPGEEYEKNRHNTGFLVLDELKSRISNFQFPISNKDSNFKSVNKLQSKIFKSDGIIFAKPRTMMNNSGVAVRKLTDFYKAKLEDLWVVHDDLDIAIGEYKIQKGKGPKDHKGIGSVDKALGTRDYWHVRIGVDNRNYEPGIMNYSRKKIPGEEYVLQNFTPEEVVVLKATIEKIIKDMLNKLTN